MSTVGRVVSGAAVLILAGMATVLEVFYLPLRAGQLIMPLSVLVAVVLNVAFTRAMYALSGSVLVSLLPGAVWLAVIARAATARPEGDLLITDGSSSTALAVVNLAFLLLGVLALIYAVATVRRRPRTRGSSGPGSRRSAPPDTAGIT